MIHYIYHVNTRYRIILIAYSSKNKLITARSSWLPVIKESISCKKFPLIHTQAVISVVCVYVSRGHYNWWRSTSSTSEYKLTKMNTISILRHHATTDYMLSGQFIFENAHSLDNSNLCIWVVSSTCSVNIISGHNTIAISDFSKKSSSSWCTICEETA